MTSIALAVFLSYLLGSIPSAYIAGRWLRGIDIREVGDRNMGAANVFREIGPWAGVGVGLADAGKGAAAVLIARAVAVSEPAVLLAGLAAAVVPLLATRNMVLTCAVLFAPLPLVAWWLGAPGSLIAYSAGLPCLVGFTHYLTTRNLPQSADHEVTKRI